MSLLPRLVFRLIEGLSTMCSLLAQQSDTAKVNEARRRRNVHIVWPQWLQDSMALWQKMDEADYLLEPEPPDSGRSPANGIDSDDLDVETDSTSNGPLTGRTDISFVP